MRTLNDADFRVAAACESTRVSCVSVAVKAEGVFVRDTKGQTKVTLSFTREERDIFVRAVKHGEFDLT
jgi:hypothetical protein